MLKRLGLYVLAFTFAAIATMASTAYAGNAADATVPENSLTTVNGKQFNQAIKTLAAGTEVDYAFSDQSIKCIRFKPNHELSQDELELPSVNVGTDGEILALWDAETCVLTISSSGGIKLNPYMGYMFSRLSVLECLDLSMLETTSASYMHGIFYADENLTSLIFGSSIDTSQAQTMDNMFDSCASLVELDLSNWDVGNSVNISETFQNCTSLEKLNLSGWNPVNNRDMDQIFMNCRSLHSLNLDGWATPAVTTAIRTFSGCISLENISMSNWDVSNIASMRQMFTNCESLRDFNLKGWNVAACTDFRSFLRGCSSVEALDFSSWNVGPNVRVDKMLDGCISLKSLDFGTSAAADFSSAALPTPPTGDYSGCWVDTFNTCMDLSSDEVMERHEGGFVWRRANIAAPSDVAASQGQAVSFDVSASGAASYRWEYSTDGGQSWAKTWLDGCRTPSLAFEMQDWYAPRLFRCKVTFDDATVAYTDAASLTLDRRIVGQPSDVAASQGQAVSFDVSASGAASYRWEYSTDGGQSWAKTWLDGCRTPSLAFEMQDWYAPRLFRCKVTFDDATVAYTDAASLTLAEQFDDLYYRECG